MISQALINLIKSSEGFSSTPYRDSVGVATIGYGFTHYANKQPVTMNDAAITIDQANEMLADILQPFIDAVNKWAPDCNQNQKDALTDFAYNLGLGSLENSTLLKTIRINPNDGNIKIQFGLWVYAGNQKLAGLIKRRENEVALYFTPIA